MHSIRRAALAAGVFWAYFLLIQAAAMLALSGYWTRPGYSLPLKLWFFSSEATLAAGAAAACAAAYLLMTAACRRLGPRRRAPAAIAATLVVFFVTAVYTASWAVYSALGEFIGGAALKMAWMNAQQMLAHARAGASTQLVYGSLVAVAGTILVLVALGAVERASARTRNAVLAALVSGVLVVTLFGAAYGLRVRAQSDAASGIASRDTANVLRSAQRAGPFSYLRDELITGAAHRTLPAPRNADPSRYSHDPVIDIGDYLAGVTPPARKTSVILLVVESLRPDTLRAFGGPLTVMPQLESLARESVRFRDVYAQSSHSNYADIAIVSSQYPLRSRDIHYYPEQPPYPRVMLQDILVPLGYRAGLFSSQNEYWGGMIHFIDSGRFDRIVHSGNFEGLLRPERNPYRDERYREYRQDMADVKRAGKIDDSTTIGLAIDWLDGLAPADPFFLQLNLQNSHMPYYVPEDFPRRFFTHAGEPLEKLLSGRVTELTSEQMHMAYLDSLAYMDSQIGRLFDLLKARGQWNDTLVVVTGDTATSFYEILDFGGNGKVARIIGNGGMLVQEVMRVPLLIRAPGLAPRDYASRVQHIDVVPAVLDLLDLPQHPALQGASPFGGQGSQPRPVFLVAQTPAAVQYAVVLEDWKLIYDAWLRRFLLEYIGAGEPREASPPPLEAMHGELTQWMHAQLSYYEDSRRVREFYPPDRRVPP